VGVDKGSQGKKPLNGTVRNQPHERNMVRSRIIAIGLSFAVGATLMAFKFYVYDITGSAAVLSDALESIINVVASGLALVAILVAAKPPDESHPYGHGKIEYFSAGFEGALIILAAFGIFKTGWAHLFYPREIPQLEKGLWILFGVSIVNLLLGLGLIRVGKRTDSITLIADGKHVLTDVYTSGGVLVGLFLVQETSVLWLDGGIACLVGLNILFLGWRLIRQSFLGLMDTADTALLKEIASLIHRNRKDLWIDIHELRAFRAGAFVHIDLHLILPRSLSLEESHSEAKALEKMIVTHFGGRASVLIHTDPCVDPDCPICSNHLCEQRVHDLEERMTWDAKTLTSQGGAGKRNRDAVS
jgi:cation diffusion facilitator family transporter